MPNPAPQSDETDYLTLLRNEFPPVAGATLDPIPIAWRVSYDEAARVGLPVSLGLALQYARRFLQDGLLQGRYNSAINWKLIDIELDDSASIKNLMAARTSAQAEIERLEGIARRRIGVINLTTAARRGNSGEWGA